MIAEAIERLIMALVFFYLGGLVCGTAFAINLGAEGMEALQFAAAWPVHVYHIMVVLLGAAV